MSAQLREAAAVILLRRARPGFEVFLLRRHKRASVMASAFGFPGGAAEAGEGPRTAAARPRFGEPRVLHARADERGARETGGGGARGPGPARRASSCRGTPSTPRWAAATRPR